MAKAHRQKVTESKMDRDRIKRENRQRKQEKRVGKPVGVEGIGHSKPRKQRQWVELKRVGGGWRPDLTVKAFNDLKRAGKAEIGAYSFVKDYSRSNDKQLVFEAMVGADLTTKKKYRKHFGFFLIDFEKRTIKKIYEGEHGVLSSFTERDSDGRRLSKARASRIGKPDYRGYKHNPEIPTAALENILQGQNAKSGHLTFTVTGQTQANMLVTITGGKKTIGKYKVSRHLTPEGARSIYDG